MYMGEERTGNRRKEKERKSNRSVEPGVLCNTAQHLTKIDKK